MFNVDFNKLVVLILPPHKRQSKRVVFLQSLTSPFIDIYNEFKSYRNAVLNELYFDGSTIYFEKLLNDKFNNGGTGIEIETMTSVNTLFVPTKTSGGEKVWVKNKGVAGDPVWVSNKGYYDDEIDFEVKIPVSLYVTLNLNEVKAFINKYRLAGKLYSVVSVGINPA